MASTNRVFPGPNREAMQALLSEWAGDQEGAEPIVCPGMRSDFTGLGPVHVAALMGRVEELKDVERLGGRTVWHLAALAGHFAKSLPFMGELGSVRGEYRETPAQVHVLTAEKTAVDRGGYYEMNSSHVPSTELLKLWMTTKPTKKLFEQDLAVRARIGEFEVLPKGAIRFDPERQCAVAASFIPANQIIAPVHGVFTPSMMLPLYLDHRFVVSPTSYEKPGAISRGLLDTFMDGSECGNALNRVSTAGIPNVEEFEVPATGGRPVATHFYALTDIEPGTVLTYFNRVGYERVRADLEEVNIDQRRIIVGELLDKGAALITMPTGEFSKMQFKAREVELTPHQKTSLEWLILTPQVWARMINSEEITFEQLRCLFRLYYDAFLVSARNIHIQYADMLILFLNLLVDEPEFQKPFNEHFLQPFMAAVGRQFEELSAKYVEPDYIFAECRDVMAMLRKTPDHFKSIKNYCLASKLFIVEGGIRIRFIFHPITLTREEVTKLVANQTL